MALWRLIAPAPNSRSLLWWKPLALSHVIGVSPRWVVLAVADTTIHRGEILVEFVPCELIFGVSVHAGQAEGEAIGGSPRRGLPT